MAASVLLVDDHAVVRMALRITLVQHGYEVVGEATDGADAQRLARELQPDLVILDLGIPLLDGVVLIPRLQTVSPGAKILVFTANTLLANRCRRLGVSGFVSKDEDMDGIMRALESIKSGYSYFPMDAFSSVASAGSNDDEQMLSTLTDREMVVLKYLAQGKSNKQIGDLMLLSNKTISTYKAHIMEKTNSHTLLNLVDFAKRCGLT